MRRLPSKSKSKLWHSSQHERAMAHATDKSVLGDFNDASFQYFDVQSRFFRKDGKFFVETDGPDGKLATYQVKYTFGVDPLQQYLIEFPDGRLQALSVAWDSRPKDKGGQRWFHLYPNENIRHDDVLHWTKLNQNWNFMCAECHSTGVQKNYDAAADRFATKWAEISVGCEACHGAGSRHVAWAQDKKSWWPASKQEDRTKGLAGAVRRTSRHDLDAERKDRNAPTQRHAARVCARKSKRAVFVTHDARNSRKNGFPGSCFPTRICQRRCIATCRTLTDRCAMSRNSTTYLPFKESKMFAAGVTCSDCHDPHSATLRAPGDGVCLQCHTPAKYESVSHRHHENVSSAVSCVSCHMPERSYMVVDRRHDHGFRIPRPDLSVKLGTPNACNDCHRDQSAQWAATTIETWFGPRREGIPDIRGGFPCGVDAAAGCGKTSQ